MDYNVNNIIKLTNSIYRCNQAFIDEKFQKYGLTAGSYSYLIVLNKKPGISQNEISKELSVDKAMSARTIKKLIELGYVEKIENENDVRCFKLYITENGKKIVPDIKKVIDDWIEILLKGNSKENVEKGIQFLKLVLNNGNSWRKTQGEEVNKV
jgi:DNA-binding MarR family transcriptional regulator